MVAEILTLRNIVLSFVCKNLDLLFYKQLYKISRYLRENKCNDLTEYFIDHQELYDESDKENCGNSQNNAVDVLRNFLKSQGLPKIVWQESNHHDETTVGIEVNDVKVVVSDKKRSNARYLAAKLMLRKLFPKYLSCPILNKYNQHEQSYRRAPLYRSDSYLRGQNILECTINPIDELQNYYFTEEERWEILRNIPEYRLKRSHYLLVIHPYSQTLDFSFCPAVFSPHFLELVLKKARRVETVDLSNCSKSVPDSLNCVPVLVKKCRKTLMSLSLNKCGSIMSEEVVKSLRRCNVDLERLSISEIMKNNEKGSLEFQKYLTSQLGGRLRYLDVSGLSMCENELYYILNHCKRLVSLNLSKTRFDRRCYCENHDPCVKFDSTVIKSLLELNVSRSSCSKKVIKLLIDKNRDLRRLLKASSELSSAETEPLNLRTLEHMRDLDMSFQGSGAYEDFSLYKNDLPISLSYLNASGYCDMDISHLSVVCPFLKSLTLNSCIINTKITCRTREDFQGKVERIPHSIQNFIYLQRLELRYSTVNLTELLESKMALPLEELVIEGDCLDDVSLPYIVNSQVQVDQWTVTHVFNKLKRLDICNCNQVTMFGIHNCSFSTMPALRNLTIERCSAIPSATLERLQDRLKFTKVTLTCFIEDEKPRFHVPARHIEVVMG